MDTDEDLSNLSSEELEFRLFKYVLSYRWRYTSGGGVCGGSGGMGGLVVPHAQAFAIEIYVVDA